MNLLRMALCCILAATISLSCVGCRSAGLPQNSPSTTPNVNTTPSTTAVPTTQATTPTVPPTTVPPTTVLPYVGTELGPIDWDLTVTRISTITGQPLDGTWTFTMNGDIHDHDDQWVYFFLNMSFGEHLPYLVFEREEGTPTEKTYFEYYGYYSSSDFYYKKYTNETGQMRFALDPVNGLVIILFDDGTGHFYVGSVDPDVDPMDIYNRFSDFVEWNS